MSEFTCLSLLHVPGAGSKRKDERKDEKHDFPKANKKLKVAGSPWQEQHTPLFSDLESREVSHRWLHARESWQYIFQVTISDVVKCVP